MWVACPRDLNGRKRGREMGHGVVVVLKLVERPQTVPAKTCPADSSRRTAPYGPLVVFPLIISRGRVAADEIFFCWNWFLLHAA